MTMSSKHEIKEPLIPQPRYGQTSAQKSAGATYTPPLFAAFVADQMVRIASLPSRGVIRVLDPAVGDGALLDALIHRLPVAVRKRVEIFGYDTDSHAIKVASERLHGDFPTLKFHLQEKDFLDHVLDLQGGRDLFHDDKPQPPFDLVIANPPYVRTRSWVRDKHRSWRMILVSPAGWTCTIRFCWAYQKFWLKVARRA